MGIADLIVKYNVLIITKKFKVLKPNIEIHTALFATTVDKGLIINAAPIFRALYVIVSRFSLVYSSLSLSCSSDTLKSDNGGSRRGKKST